MRFVWKNPPTGSSLPTSELEVGQISVEANESPQDVKEQREHLSGYFNASKKENIPSSFGDDILDWYNSRNKISMRLAGVSRAENAYSEDNKTGYLTKHARLSSAFVEFDDDDSKVSGTFNFSDNELAKRKLSGGDIFPPEVKALYIIKDGKKVLTVRTINPFTGRIGVYAVDDLKKGQKERANWKHVSVGNGDKFEITRTSKATIKEIETEHDAIFKEGAASVDDGKEELYNDHGDLKKVSDAEEYAQGIEGVKAKHDTEVANVQSSHTDDRAALMQSFGGGGGGGGGGYSSPSYGAPAISHSYSGGGGGAPRSIPISSPSVPYRPSAQVQRPEKTAANKVKFQEIYSERGNPAIDIGGHLFPKLTQSFLKMHIANNAGEMMSKWRITEDPITGGPCTLFGEKIRYGISSFLYASIKEFEARMLKGRSVEAYRQDPSAYKMESKAGGVQAFAWRNTKGASGVESQFPSNHSWCAIDINPGYNSVGNRWESLNPNTRIPRNFVKVAGDCGLRWLGGPPVNDAMHLEQCFNLFALSKEEEDRLFMTDQGKAYYQLALDQARKNFDGKYARNAAGRFAKDEFGKRVPLTLKYLREEWQRTKKSIKSPRGNRKSGSGGITIGGSPPSRPSRPSSGPVERKTSSPFAEFNEVKNEKSSGFIDNGLNSKIRAACAPFDRIIEEAAQKYNVPANLIRGVIWQESTGDPDAASSASAGGLMQLMPRTATSSLCGFKSDEIFPKIKVPGIYDKLDPRDARRDPRRNIIAGTKLLSNLLGTIKNGRRVPRSEWKKSIPETLACYNWGSGNVARYKRGERYTKGKKKGQLVVPPAETRGYIATTGRSAYRNYLSLTAAA